MYIYIYISSWTKPKMENSHSFFLQIYGILLLCYTAFCSIATYLKIDRQDSTCSQISKNRYVGIIFFVRGKARTIEGHRTELHSFVLISLYRINELKILIWTHD